jgi:hypothetical protein
MAQVAEYLYSKLEALSSNPVLQNTCGMYVYVHARSHVCMCERGKTHNMPKKGKKLTKFNTIL